MLQLESVDFDVLPRDLLVAVKRHCRVEFDRDDSYLVEATARAIAEIESVTDLSVNPAMWIWEPSNCYEISRERVPKSPTRQMDEIDDQGVVTGTVDLKWYGDNAFAPELWSAHGRYRIHCGYLAALDISPAVLNPILMLTGTLYEQREAVQAGSFNELPDMANRLFSGLWRPAV